MKLAEPVLAKLVLDEELREEIEQARAVTSPIARRRAERALAGYLRSIDLDELEAQMISLEAQGNLDTRLFHRAEQWRARLIAEGSTAAAEFPGGWSDPLPALVENARRERDTGKPPGAARALFRHVMKVLQAERGGT